MPASLKHLTSKRVNYYSLLARWKDGLYYTASLLKCDNTKKRCLVCFEDGSEIWANNRDLHIQLSLDQLKEDEDILCCICDDGESDSPNLIILCDVCNQGYHQKCHNPPVDKSIIEDDHKDWICATCSYILRQKDRAQLDATAQQRQQQKQEPQKHQQEKQREMPPPPPPPQQQKRPAEASPQIQKKLQQERPQPSVDTTSPTTIVRQPAKVKQTPVIQPQHQVIKSSIGPVKAIPINNNSPQKQVPHYPLSGQVRVVASSSTAALASMTASSALVVGSSSGRTKQDLVNQSNKSSQRQARQLIGNVQSEAAIAQGPPKHAVRKSSVNFAPSPVRQSALPTATRSPLPSGNNTTTIQSKVIPQPRTNVVTTIASTKPTTSIIMVDNNNCISKPSGVLSSPSPVRINPINNHGVPNTNLSPKLATSPVAVVGPPKLVTSSSMSDAQVVSTSAPVVSSYKPIVINQSNSTSSRPIVLYQQGAQHKAHSTTPNLPAVTTTTTTTTTTTVNVVQVKNDSDDGASGVKMATNSDVTSNPNDNREAS